MAPGPFKAAPAVTTGLVEVGLGRKVLAGVGALLVTIVVGRKVLMGGGGGSRDEVGFGGGAEGLGL